MRDGEDGGEGRRVRSSDSGRPVTKEATEMLGRMGRRFLSSPLKKIKSEMAVMVTKRKTRKGEACVPEVVREAEYYHGMIHKDELGALLRKDGDFVLRLGRSNLAAERVTLSVQWQGQARHFILYWAGTGSKRRVWVEVDRQFPDESKLVQWHMETGTKLGVRGCVLRTPVTHQSWELEVGDIHLEKEIGAGAFGKVWSGKLDLGNKKVAVAVKQCESAQLSLAAQNIFMKEAEIGRRLNHPNVVRCYGVQHRQEPLMIVMELAEGGGLRSRLRLPPPNSPSPAQLLLWSREACAAMEYLDQKNILHRDVAARNFLCGPSPALTVKLADFGLAKADMQTYKMKTNTKMAVKWMAPEVMMSGEFSKASEVWAFGVVLWEIHSRGEEPFKGYAAVEIKERVGGREKLRLACPSWLREDLSQLIQSCWASAPSARPKIGRLGVELDRMLGRIPARLLPATMPDHSEDEHEPSDPTSLTSSVSLRPSPSSFNAPH